MSSTMPTSKRSQNGVVIAKDLHEVAEAADFPDVYEGATHEMASTYGLALRSTSEIWAQPPVSAGYRSGAYFARETGHLICFTGSGIGTLYVLSGDAEGAGRTEEVGSFSSNTWAYIPPHCTYCFVTEFGQDMYIRGVNVTEA